MTKQQKKSKILRLKNINLQLENEIGKHCRVVKDLRRRISDNETEMENLENEILFD